MKEPPKATQMSRKKILKKKPNKMFIKYNKHKGSKVGHFEHSS
jgi:hypothetical protein